MLPKGEALLFVFSSSLFESPAVRNPLFLLGPITKTEANNLSCLPLRDAAACIRLCPSCVAVGLRNILACVAVMGRGVGKPAVIRALVLRIFACSIPQAAVAAPS